MDLHSKGHGVVLVIVMVLASLLPAGGARAQGEVIRGDLRGRIDLDVFPVYDGPRGIPSSLEDPDDHALLLQLVDLLDDVDEPDEGDRAIVDPDYFQAVLETGPDLDLRLNDDRESRLERILSVVNLYDRLEERWVLFSRHVGGWRDDTVSHRLELVDGGRYDLGSAGDGRVEVAMALGVGVVEDDDGPGFLLSFGGCQLTSWPLGVLFLLLLPLAGLATSRKRV